MSKKKDIPFHWKTATPAQLWVDCPECNHAARVINCSVSARRHCLNFEVICPRCDKYRYITMEVPNGRLLNPRYQHRTYGARKHFRVGRLADSS